MAGIILFNGTTIAGSSFVNSGTLASPFGGTAVYADTAVDITNLNLISFPADYGHAATLGRGSSFTNTAGAIAIGGRGAIHIGGPPGAAIGTVVNQGSIAATGTTGVTHYYAVSGAASVTNGSPANTLASITGGVAVGALSGPTNLTNFATITGNLVGFGVLLGEAPAAGGDLVNGSSGSTAAYISGRSGARVNGSIANFGTIIATSFYAVTVTGNLTNGASGASAGTISGVTAGVSSDGTVMNYGLIQASAGKGVMGSPLRVINGAPGATAARIEGSAIGVSTGAPVQNYGTIAGTGTAGIGAQGLDVVNGMSGSTIGLITGVAHGVAGPTGTLSNYSLVTATGANAYGVHGKALVTNFGTISAAVGTGSVGIMTSRTISNTPGGVVEGSAAGIRVIGLGNPITVTNMGTVRGIGAASVGIDVGLAGSANPTNTATGIISGGAYGVAGLYGYFTNYGQVSGDIGIAGLRNLTNGGTITGTGTAGVAVSMSQGRLQVLPGAVFNGSVLISGLTTSNELHLAGTGDLGTITNLGVDFQGFGNIRVDAGTHWLLDGANPATGSTLDVRGQFDLAGATMSGLADLRVPAGGTLAGHGTIGAATAHWTTGIVRASGGTLAVPSGQFSGTFAIDPAATLRFTGAPAPLTQPLVTFNGGGNGAGATLVFDTPSSFFGVFKNLAQGDVVDLAGITATGASISGNMLTITRTIGADLSYSLIAPDLVNPIVSIATDGAGGSLIKFAGDDTYIATSTTDFFIEHPQEGTDRVVASVPYILPANIENLTQTGFANLRGWGNAGDNNIAGNTGNNKLRGGAGNDTISGGDGDDTLTGGTGGDSLAGGFGHDTLDGGAGADTMAGGAEDDIYVVATPNDLAIENPGEGSDTVISSSPFFMLGANVETLLLAGAGNFIGWGNPGDNVIIGNAGDNQIRGGQGNDTIDGGASPDSLTGGTGNDSFIFHAGQANNDLIADFLPGADHLIFLGFAPGATFTLLNPTDWKITPSGGGALEILHFPNTPAITPADFHFA